MSNTGTVEPAAVDASTTHQRQLYTPAMLAELLGMSVRTVRRWQRAGFLHPATEVMQLPYFDYAGLTVARQLATWMQQGASVPSIQAQLDALQRHAGCNTPLPQLPISAEGKRLVLRRGDQYLEASGQLRFGFETPDEGQHETKPQTIQMHAADRGPRQPWTPTSQHADESLTLDSIVDQAIASEDEGDLDQAIEWYRTGLAIYGPDANICFQLAELLYRQQDVSGARERYFMALEINSDLVEARANLGCVLAECGELDLAVAAFEGALEQFADYADVHFHLARVLDAQGEMSHAVEHWQRFLELAPASPWAEEAQQRLEQNQPWLEF